MPFDHEPEEEEGGDDGRHEKLDEFAVKVALSHDALADIAGVCAFCSLPRVIRELTTKLFCDAADSDIPERDVMLIIEAMANEARDAARKINAEG